MFLEPPAKRQRLMAGGPGASDDDDSDFDELNYEPHQVTEMRDPDYKLVKKRVAANNRFQSAMADIIERYDRDFGETGDEISFATGELVVDRGHLSGLRVWADSGSGEEDEGEPHGDGDEEEGIRLEDFLDEWEDENGAEEAPDDSLRQDMNHGEADALQPAPVFPSPMRPPQDLAPREETHTPLRFEVAIPSHKKSPIVDNEVAGRAHHIGEIGAGDAAIPETAHEEYDSGFASSSSECRRSGRVRKQVDFLGKITWAEALPEITGNARTRSPSPSLRDNRTLADEDYEIKLPTSSSNRGASLAAPRQASPALNADAMVPDSLDNLEPPDSSQSQNLTELSNEEPPSAAEIVQNNVTEPAPLDTRRMEVPDSQEYDLSQDAVVSGFTKAPTPELSETTLPVSGNQMDEEFAVDKDTVPLVNDRGSGISQPIPISEIPDSQEPSSSPDQELPESHIKAKPNAGESQSNDTEGIGADAGEVLFEASPTGNTPMSFDDWVRASSPIAEASSTPSGKRRDIIQQVTPGPSPNKHSTPSKPRPSSGTPRTPRHSTTHTSKAPSSRRSILSLLSDDNNDTGRRSEDEDELVRDASDYTVTVTKLFDSARKRRKSRSRNAFLTPVKQRTERRMTPLSSAKVCGQGDKKCGSSFCFTCM